MRFLKTRFYDIIVCSCIIIYFFPNIYEIFLLASSTINCGLWPHVDDRYCAFDHRLTLPHSYVISSTTKLADRVSDLMGRVQQFGVKLRFLVVGDTH